MKKCSLSREQMGWLDSAGGADINCNRFHALHDVQCRVKGHAAWQLLQRFITRWEAHPDTANYQQLSGKCEPEPPRPPAYASGSWNYVKVIHTYNHWKRPELRDRSLKDTIFYAIQNAERSIYIEDQYLVNLEVAALLNERLKQPVL